VEEKRIPVKIVKPTGVELLKTKKKRSENIRKGRKGLVTTSFFGRIRQFSSSSSSSSSSLFL
jgi:hypothetical protein